MTAQKPKSCYDYWGIECGEGWKSLYDPLIDACTREGVAILQIKEKFGGLRFYVADAPDHIREAIHQAEARSFETCERCGEPGKQLNKKGWFKVRCDDCARSEKP